jgi:type II secretory pathway component PulF
MTSPLPWCYKRILILLSQCSNSASLPLLLCTVICCVFFVWQRTRDGGYLQRNVRVRRIPSVLRYLSKFHRICSRQRQVSITAIVCVCVVVFVSVFNVTPPLLLPSSSSPSPSPPLTLPLP